MKTIARTRLTAEQEREFVREAYENFPENSVSLRCLEWNYKKFEFVFEDEEGKTHMVREADAVRGLRLLAAAVEARKLPGLGLPAGYLDPKDGLSDWDAMAFDALNQMAIYGEVIYG